MWDLILNPFITVLTFLYSILNHDIVLAIIVFTILVRIITYPLTAQQQRSARAMQELQPKIKQLQEKYKNDREKLQQEQMRIYREHGVNPLGGCLPLLIQFPILIGLYQAILACLGGTPMQVVDLSGRLLIPDLAHLIPLNNTWLGMNLTLPPTANPVFAMVFPLLVLVTTWFQSKVMTPTPAASADDDGKPDQTRAMTQSMTTIMPLMFGFFSLSFSVGLSIYFIASNLVGIAQYAMMGKTDFRRLIPGRRETTSQPERIDKPSGKPKAKALQKPSKAK